MKDQVVYLVEKYLGRIRRFSGQGQVIMKCPFHKGGNEDKPSFSISVEKGIFQCFSCKAKGTVIDLLLKLGVPRPIVEAETADIKKAIEEQKKNLYWKRQNDWTTKDPFEADPIINEIYILPYKQWCPPNLVQEGFDMNLLQIMEIGVDTNSNRVTYPVRDVYGHLAGVSGGALIKGTIPKYKVYQGGRQDPITGQFITGDFGPGFDEQYPRYRFINNDHLWNYHRVFPRLFYSKEVTNYLIIVEGFKACLWMLQNGYWNTVALMGSSITPKQTQLIQWLGVPIVLFLDWDEAGQKGAYHVGKTLQRITQRVYFARYPEVTTRLQPDNLRAEELTSAIMSAFTYPQFIARRNQCHQWTA